jgi:ParB family transcriptional regulator, chromosome partitioning protein
MTERKSEKRGLGRGLSALLADMQVSAEGSPTEFQAMGKGDQANLVRSVPIEDIHPNPGQPRRSFEEPLLRELAESISTQGVLQPLIVRPRPGSTGFEIVAGERRWRAAQLAQLHELPVIVRDFDDEAVLQVAIIENIQRSDLNPVEEARGYRQLIDQFGHTQERVSEAVGKSRSHIANLLRLLALPDDVLDLVASGSISSGHARALVTLENPSDLARQIVAKGLTVRDAEEMARRFGQGRTKTEKRAGRQGRQVEKDPDTMALERDLALNLGMGVSIYHEPGGERGTLKVYYNTLDDLDRVCRALSSVPKDMDF